MRKLLWTEKLFEEMEAMKFVFFSEFYKNPFKMFKILSDNDTSMAIPKLFISLR